MNSPVRTILVVIPTYNERDNITAAVEGAAAVPGVSVLVVDDSSPDGTGEVADAVAARHHGRVSVMHRPRKSGLGGAYLAGFRFGLDRGFDAICEMDADGSHDPAALPRLIDGLRSGADVVIGSRRVPGGAIIGWGPHRHFMSRSAAAVSRLVLGLKTKDVTSGFRCYRSGVVTRLLEGNIESDGYAFQEETLFRCERSGYRIVEVPIVFRDRTKGRSKLSWKDVIQFFSAIVRLRMRKKR